MGNKMTTNRRQSSAIDRSKLARSAKGIGDLITRTAKAKRLGVEAVPPPPPAVPATKPKRKASGKEAGVLRACLKALHKAGIFAYRQNTGTLWTNGQPVSFGFPGAADITGILPDGRRLEIECKSTIGKQSAKQKKFEAKIKANGGVYILAHSVDEMLGRLEEWQRAN
ncbi:MAG: hypothetical protein GY832_31510 [Chloroflexi bacterium]|nr:hypothetical protein [Chloroflexota bacterium]